MVMQPARPLFYVAVAYFAIGFASAVVTNPIAVQTLQALLRITALVLGALVYLAHVRYEVVRLRNPVRRSAVRVAVAVALGVFLLAVYMVLYNVLVRSRAFASVALVLIVWPAVAGALGFLGAAVVARILVRRQRGGKAS